MRKVITRPEELRADLIKKQGKHPITRAELEELIAAWPGEPSGEFFRRFLVQKQTKTGDMTNSKHRIA